MSKEKSTPTYGPASKPFVLSSGRLCTLVQPDMYELASGRIDLPNQAKLDVWDLLLRYNTTDDPTQQLLSDEKWVRSHYYAAQIALQPRLKLDDDDAEGVIDRRELSLPNLLAIYDFCRFGLPTKATAYREPGDGQDAASPSDGVPPAAE